VVNAFGREVTWPGIELLHEEPTNGANLHLTIDSRLQEAAREGLADRRGAVAALDPRTGEVLALYSAPSLDLNRLSLPEGNAYWKELVTDKGRPLYNRAIQGTYPPASTFKITTSSAALGEGEITPRTELFCGGGLNFGGRFYQCWRDGGHGHISLARALASSCDTFFYQLGLKLGPDKIARYAGLLGLGGLTGIDIPGEKAGLVPTEAWKEKRFGVRWQAGESLSTSVGQGYNTVTPLQNAVMIATIAGGGKKVIPHTASKLIDKNGNVVYAWQEKQQGQVLPQEVVKSIKEGLEGAVEGPEGTANRLKALGLKIAGKTGTAQVISKEAWRGGVEELKDHAWFVGYAPYDDPKIAVAVIVEHGGFGASAAAPVAGRIIETYLKK
jgi:penicillin-binding protein 2